MAERGSITIRNVPESLHRELTTRAALRGRSLQEYLPAELRRLPERPSAEDLVARIRSRKAASGSHMPAEDILAARDAVRR